MSTSSERYRPTPAFESLGFRAAGGVSLIMECGLVSVMRGNRVVPIRDERGEGWVFASVDERFAVEARPIDDSELAGEDKIRAYLVKRGEWFSTTARVFMTTKHDLLYWDQEMGGNNTTQVVSTLTFEIPAGDGQTCRWVGLTGSFQDVNGQPDPRGEEVFLRDIGDTNKFDGFILSCASDQVVASTPGLA